MLSAPTKSARFAARAPRALQAQHARSVQARGLLSWLPGMGSSSSSPDGGAAPNNKGGWQPATEGQERLTSMLGWDVTPMTAAARREAAEALAPLARNVCLNQGTERPFTGATANGYPHDCKNDGVYACALGGLPLFDSKTKFDSGTGWPSFYAPIDPQHVLEIKDASIPFMVRTEVVCARSGAHLGHVFPDGPKPTRLRYCMNAAAMTFIPRKDFEAMKPDGEA